MSRSRIATAVAAVVVVAGLVAPTAPASAVAATVTNVSVTPSSVSVDDLGDALVTVQVDIDEPRGIPTIVRVGFASTSGSLGLRGLLPDLAEVPGTRVGTKATYRTSWLLGATQAGYYYAKWASWDYDGDYGGDKVDLGATAPGRTLLVVGTRPPTMSVVLVPAVVHYGERQWARSTFLRHDGTPLARAAIVAYHCEGDGCSPPASATTDAGGRYDLRLLTDNNNSCRLLLPSMATPGARFDAFWVSAARRQTYVAVRAQAVAAVRRGRSFVVSATVLPGGGQVALQRLVGRTWRTTTSTTVSFTGAARLVGSSTVLGNQYFRLRAHGPADILPTTSRYFVVLGTRR